MYIIRPEIQRLIRIKFRSRIFDNDRFEKFAWVNLKNQTKMREPIA